ncbi:hypothetical protein VCSRO155_3260 [Vibrio cholerae]|nr:hypothetical protein DA89_1382 [Vibrio paracholerae]GHX00998.1 hypothetical protein VCSRO155_3260 [Vibrio cholerae]
MSRNVLLLTKRFCRTTKSKLLDYVLVRTFKKEDASGILFLCLCLNDNMTLNQICDFFQSFLALFQVVISIIDTFNTFQLVI